MSTPALLDEDRLAGDAAWLVGGQEEATAYPETLDQDSRFDEVNAAWASCMADAGFTDRSPAAAEQRLRDDQSALVADGTWPENEVVSQRAETSTASQSPTSTPPSLDPPLIRVSMARAPPPATEPRHLPLE